MGKVIGIVIVCMLAFVTLLHVGLDSKLQGVQDAMTRIEQRLDDMTGKRRTTPTPSRPPAK